MKGKMLGKVLVIDNYDSFTFNLVQVLLELGVEVWVFRNDEIEPSRILEMEPTHILISPGPGKPESAGICKEVVRQASGVIPILGVCLGHQVIGEVMGGKVVPTNQPIHGKTSLIYHDSMTIFAGLPNPIEATRYHSLVVERESLPACLEVSATTQDGLVMGLRHKDFPVEGVQFHPESFLTQKGRNLLENFLRTSCEGSKEKGAC